MFLYFFKWLESGRGPLEGNLNTFIIFITLHIVKSRKKWKTFNFKLYFNPRMQKWKWQKERFAHLEEEKFHIKIIYLKFVEYKKGLKQPPLLGFCEKGPLWNFVFFLLLFFTRTILEPFCCTVHCTYHPMDNWTQYFTSERLLAFFSGTSIWTNKSVFLMDLINS